MFTVLPVSPSHLKDKLMLQNEHTQSKLCEVSLYVYLNVHTQICYYVWYNTLLLYIAVPLRTRESRVINGRLITGIQYGEKKGTQKHEMYDNETTISVVM